MKKEKKEIIIWDPKNETHLGPIDSSSVIFIWDGKSQAKAENSNKIKTKIFALNEKQNPKEIRDCKSKNMGYLEEWEQYSNKMMSLEFDP